MLKLVGFQILATLSTIGSFVGDTNGALNRDWCACAAQPPQPHATRPAAAPRTPARKQPPRKPGPRPPPRRSHTSRAASCLALTLTTDD